MKIELKSLDEIDPSQLAYHANNKDIRRYLRNTFPYPYTIEHALSFIQLSLKNRQLDFGIVVDDICVGCISATLKNDIYIYNCEIGYWLGQDYWNRGIMCHVINMMVQFLFQNYHIHKIYAEIFAENFASAKVLEKNGFVVEGYFKDHIFKDGVYHDAKIYSLLGENLYDSSLNER